MKKIIDLYSAPADIKLTVEDFKTGLMVKKRLLALGLHSGDQIQKISNYHHGPVLIITLKEFPNQIVIGKGLARKIFVSYEQL